MARWASRTPRDSARTHWAACTRPDDRHVTHPAATGYRTANQERTRIAERANYGRCRHGRGEKSGLGGELALDVGERLRLVAIQRAAAEMTRIAQGGHESVGASIPFPGSGAAG